MFKKFVCLLLITSFGFLSSGCSMFVSHKQSLGITTSEPDAQIYVNGEFIGNGNMSMRVPRDQSVSIMAKKDGFYPATRDIGTKMSFIGILDIIGGCCFLLPFIGLAFPGSHSLDRNNVAIVLQKESK